jgi:hypothetical protein
LGDIVVLNNTKFNNFQPKIFEPYSTFMFNLEGTANSKTASTFVLVIVIELNLPPLYVNIPEYAIISKINKNDDL